MSGFTPGSVYNENPALPEVDGKPGNEYRAVQHDSGRVLQYEYVFTPRSISDARTEVMRQFPGDARIAWFTAKGTCAQMLVQSNVLRHEIARSDIGDKDGTALVEFGSEANGGESYDPSAVSYAILMLSAGATPAGASTAPGC